MTKLRSLDEMFQTKVLGEMYHVKALVKCIRRALKVLGSTPRIPLPLTSISNLINLQTHM